jgi:hypothetical protein
VAESAELVAESAELVAESAELVAESAELVAESAELCAVLQNGLSTEWNSSSNSVDLHAFL